MLRDSEYDQVGVHTLSRGGMNRFGNTYWSSATARLLPGKRFDVGRGAISMLSIAGPLFVRCVSLNTIYPTLLLIGGREPRMREKETRTNAI